MTAIDLRRVMIFVHSDTFGGPHNQVVQMRPFLEADGWSPQVFLPEGTGNALERLRGAGVDAHALPLLRPKRSTKGLLEFALGFVPHILRLAKVIRESQPDVVQTHGLFNFDVLLAARLCGVATIWEIIDTRPPSWCRSLIGHAFRGLADVFVVTGRGMVREYPFLSRCRNVLDFIPASDVANPGLLSASEVRARLGIGEQDFLLGCLGNFNRQKGFDRAVDVTSTLSRICEQKVVLRIRGSEHATQGTLLADLRDYASVRLADDRAVATLDSEGLDALSFIAALDLLLIPSESRSEGIPTVMMEAMGLSTPVASVVVGGVGSVLTGRGLCLGPGRTADWANELRDFIADDALRNRLSEAAMQFVRERATVEAMSRVHVEALVAAAGVVDR